MKKPLLLAIIILLSLSIYAQNAWINEIHYDDMETDIDETIEVVIENVASWSLGDFTITLYNGDDGESYSTLTLDQYTAGTTVNGYSIFYYNYTANGFSLQNGAPDGLALAYENTLIPGQFLSYEGSFTAVNGPASGLTSTDIGVEEPGEAGTSLQLSGNGTQYDHFTWQPPANATYGEINNAQTFGSIAPDPEPDNHVTNFTGSEQTWYSATLIWSDATGTNLPDGYLLKFSSLHDTLIAEPVDGIPEANNDSTQNIAYDVEQATFYRLLSQQNYHFKIWPYSNSGSDINYKTDSDVPVATATTTAQPSFINHETFETGSLGSWTPWSVASNKDWEVSNAINGAIGTEWTSQIYGYQEDEPSNDWLISPLIPLGLYENEKLCFYSRWKYGNSMEELQLKYSSDYEGGDPTTATWTILPFTKPSMDDTWVFSDTLFLSNLTDSDIHLAFHYLSSSSPRRWNVDEIQLTGEEIEQITVLTPETGAEWFTGNSYDITWSGAQDSALLHIYFSENASLPTPTWTLIAEDVPASQGLYTWAIPEEQLNSTDYRIKIEDPESLLSGLSGTFSITTPTVLPALVINEIMYNPPESMGTDQDYEFIEIYNNDTTTVNLSGYSIAGDVQYTFSSSDTFLTPGDYLVIASNPDSVMNEYGIEHVQGPYIGLLSNDTTGGEVILRNAMEMVVDQVNYDIIAPWPEQPNGYGPSLELLAPSLDNNIPESWKASHFTGGTPDTLNSIITNISGIVISEIFYDPPGTNDEGIEYIEIYNNNTEAINLGGCFFTRGIDFLFPAVIIEPENYLIITRDFDAFLTTFGLPAYQWQGGELENLTDTLEMRDILGNIVDYVPYHSQQPWDTLAAGHGRSLELISPLANNELPESWLASSNFSVILNGTDSVWCSPYSGFTPTPPIANFESDKQTIFMGDSINYIDLSENVPNMWGWFFHGGTPSYSYDQHPSQILYETPGKFDVLLKVSNYSGTDSLLRENYITVLDTTAYHIIISEIMYNPPEMGSDSLEFIELYNAEDTTIQMEGYYLEGVNVNFTFPSYQFEPGTFMLVASNPQAIMNTFAVEALPFEGSLENEGGAITLYTPKGTIIDEVIYDDEAPWPIAPDGEGPSLVLCDMALDNMLPESWSASLDMAAINAEQDTIWASPLSGCNNLPFPLAAFTAEPLSGTPGLTVSFYDLSTHNPTQWLWEFPGGVPEQSTLQNPVISYPTAGDFDVTLTVQNHWGSDTHTETEFIHITVGINQEQPITMSVSPNPSHQGLFRVNTSGEDLWHYTICNMAGTVIKRDSFSQKEHTIDLSSVENGVYLLQITNHLTTKNIKLIKN
ncbi:MAG: hypothetical protein CSA04_06010 [Bacteroidetes bacterium]|nr:MAG: hypothetical protein CSA04_06010 [Bacteroidota bacterium]